MEKNRYNKIQTQTKGGVTTCRTSQKKRYFEKREIISRLYQLKVTLLLTW